MIIYKVTNKINNKIYIGMDSKNDPNYLGSGLIIKKAVLKYGKDNFIKEIIETCDTKEILSEREIFWINYFNSTNPNIGYNLSEGGKGGNLGEKVNKLISEALKGKTKEYMKGNSYRKGLPAPNKGKHMSEEQKEKLRKPKTKDQKIKMSATQKKMAEEGKGACKKIICLTNNKIYKSIIEAATELNLHAPLISNVLKGKKKTTGGYKFIYL